MNRCGYTLVETIVTLAIFSIVVVLSSMLILSGGDILARDSGANTAKSIGDAVCSYLENRIRYATRLEITAATPSQSYGDKLYLEDGKLFYDADGDVTDVYGDEFYHGYSVQLAVSANPSVAVQTVQLEVTVLDRDGKAVYNAASTVKLVNMGLANNYLVSALDSYTDPAIYFSCGDIVIGNTQWDSLNQVMTRYRLMNDRYDELYREYVAAGADAVKKAEVLQKFKDYFGKSYTDFGLQRDDFNGFMFNRFDGAWPSLEDSIIAPLRDSADAKHQSIYRSITTDNGRPLSLSVRPYFLEMPNYIGRVDGAVYYATSNSSTATGWRAQLVYNTNDGCWYVYDTVRAGTGYYNMARAYEYKTVAAFLHYIETSGEWINLTKLS